MITRWLRRPSRWPRWPRALAAIVLGTLAVVGVAATPGATGSTPAAGAAGSASSAGAGVGATSTATSGSATPVSGTTPNKLPFPPDPGDPRASFPDSPALQAQGYNLYQEGCSSCHGIALRGRPGTAPSLIGVGAGPVDFYLSTGRMPLENPREEPQRNPPLYTRTQMNALIAYISRFGGPAAPTADPSKGDLATGLHLFTETCAGCHQSVARGGLTLHAVVPNLQQATAQQVAEAVRMGPYLMPRFDTKQVDQHELDSLARYVLWTRKPQNDGGWGIYNLGPIPEGMVAWFIGLAALVIVARLIGERLGEKPS